MVIVRHLWGNNNTKPAATDTPAAGGQTNLNQNEEELIEFKLASDAEAEARARQLTAEQLKRGYEIVNKSPPAAAAASAALASTIITQSQTASTSTPSQQGAPTPTPLVMAPPTPGGNANGTTQSRQDPVSSSDSALLKAVALCWNVIKVKGDQGAISQEFTWQT